VLLEEAADEADKITGRAKTASKSMVNILQGILAKGTGKYETLANLSILSDKEGVFLQEMKETVTKFQQVIRILDNIAMMETTH